jgi:leader peptidase (prepilin peptidase) / N-methyltransferase
MAMEPQSDNGFAKGPTPAGKRQRIFGLDNRPVAARRPWCPLLIGLLAVAGCVASFAAAPGVVGGCGAGLALIMLAIAVTDWRSFIIPDWLNATGLALAFVHAAAFEPDQMLSACASAALRAAVLASMFYLVRYAYARIRGRQGLGLGDVKLAAVAGAWLDFVVIPIAIELAVVGALSGYLVWQIVLHRPVSTSTRLPFGFFFAPAIWFGWLIGVTWF